MSAILIIIAGSQRILKADSAVLSLQSYYTPDPCDTSFDKSKKKITISINLGNIANGDSLFTFEFIVKYDSKLFKFDHGLFTNTIAGIVYNPEASDPQAYVQQRGDDSLICFAYTLGAKPLSGNLPLIAFSGFYLSDCIDTANFKIVGLDINPEYKKNILDTGSEISIIPVIANSPERMLAGKFDTDTLKSYDFDSLAYSSIEFSSNTNSQLRNFNIKFDISNLKGIELINIESSDTNIIVLNTTYGKDSIIAELNIKDYSKTKNKIKLTFKRAEKIDLIQRLNFEIYNVNNCNCIKTIKNDGIYLFNKKDSITYVNEDGTSYEKGNLNFSSIKEFHEYLQNQKESIIWLKAFNFNGQCIKNIEANNLNDNLLENNLNFDNLFDNYMIFIIIKNNKSEINKIVLINK